MDTFNIIREAHKGFGYLILVTALVFIVALLLAMFGYSGKISKLLKKSTLFTMILFHLQFLIGIAMLVFSPGLKAALDSGTLMSDSYNRVTFVEHPFSMLVAAVLLTIANKKIKQNETMNFAIVILSAIALALFFYAFPFAKLFNT